jgi:hypothetical protein
MCAAHSADLISIKEKNPCKQDHSHLQRLLQTTGEMEVDDVDSTTCMQKELSHPNS